MVAWLALFAWISLSSWANAAPSLIQLTPPQLWQRLEFQVTNVPAASNPFDPDLIRVEGTFTLPSGRSLVVPAFWYQDYQRALAGGYEVDQSLGPAGWRLRFAPPEPGTYSLSVQVVTNGQVAGPAGSLSFDVPATPPAGRYGSVSIAPGSRYFRTADGKPLPLIGQNVCWPDGRGTYEYDGWFAALQTAGQNFARIWMWPASFGIETSSTNLNHYALDPAWQLDYLLRLAEQKGIYLQLALDYHGMFVSQPDYWGGNNYWPQNPYNAVNGGPCPNPNAFFTNSAAMTIYQKRLRYLIGRYGYSPNLLGWEFFNEIDNDYSFLNATDVARWHQAMGAWMRANDPFGHLLTTSLSSAAGHPEIWALPQLDYISDHSYNEPSPASGLAADAQSFLNRYGKPVMIGEFGTSWQGWNQVNDPYLRGFRQGIWGGALGGSVGTAMSWWWQNIDSEHLYPVYTALGAVLNPTGWGRGAWTNVVFQTSGSPPATVSDVAPGPPFSALLLLDNNWGDLVTGKFAIPNPQAASGSAGWLESFVHGSAHANLRTPFQLSAWLTNNAQLVMHLNSVSSGATMSVRVDGLQIYSTNLPNLDGGYAVNEEYNIDIPVSLPAGKHLVEIANPGLDWFYLDWVRLDQVLPATYAGGWQASPTSIGLRGAHEALLYVVAPWASFPGGATNATLPWQQNQTITLTQWTAGPVTAEWRDPSTAAIVGYTRATTTNNLLVLPLPAFQEDLAAIVYPPPRLSVLGFSQTNGLQLQLDSRTGAGFVIEQSTNLYNWMPLTSGTNLSGSLLFDEPVAVSNGLSFLRVRQTQ